MSSNKTILKNTLFLYIRMLLTMAISLFTSRVVIDALGFTDYGIYAVVGGVVGLISFMHSSLAGATTRFMNVEIGKKNTENLKSVFNSAMIIHFSLAVLVLILAETLGLWYLHNKLNVPENRFFAAQMVYQFSVLSVMMTIIQIPYDAAIIAHQRMSVYAYISIIEAILKLVIAFVVLWSGYDKLIIYAGLVLFVSIITRLLYQVYCYRNFEECRFKWSINKEYLRSISSFFGWDLYGNLSVAVRGQGVQILQNAFFGPIVNASAGIAGMVSGIVYSFAGNFSVASKPQIFQLYAEGRIQEMSKLVFLSSRIKFFLMLLFSLPFIVKADFFLNLWLVKVPEYAVIFCKLTFLQYLLSALFDTLTQPIHATGKIKAISFLGGTAFMLTLPVLYFFLKQGGTPILAYEIIIVSIAVWGISLLWIVMRLIPDFPLITFFKNIIVKNSLIAIACIVPGIVFIQYYTLEWLGNIILIVVELGWSILIIYLLGLERTEKAWMSSKIKLFSL
jgi:O-antigen/teichoic acid export membrane protein